MSLVIKYGGNAMTDASTRAAVAAGIRRLAAAGTPPVVVHGGGPFIASALDERGLEHGFVRGLRVTTPAAMLVVEDVLTVLGKRLAEEIGPAVGLTGRDAGLLAATVADPELGRVGHVSAVDPAVLVALRAAGLVPVVASVAREAPAGGEVPGGGSVGVPSGGVERAGYQGDAGAGAAPRESGPALNVNADEVAGAVAGALREGVCFLTNVPGVLDDPADPASLLPGLTADEARARIADGRIAGGMVPKVEAALAALAQGAAFAVVADGRHPDGVARALAGGGTRLHVG